MRQKRTRNRAVASTLVTLPAPSTSRGPLPVVTTLAKDAAETNQQTAKRAAEFLLALDIGYVIPTQKQRAALLVAFAQAEQVAYGKAFDIVRCPKNLDLNDAREVGRRLSEVLVCEIKSTNKPKVKPDFSGYFFSITGGEMLTAQSLGDQYRFIFVHTQTQRYLELSLQQIFARSRCIYPTWSIQL